MRSRKPINHRSLTSGDGVKRFPFRYTISWFEYFSAKQSSATCQRRKPQIFSQLSAALIVQLKLCWIGPHPVVIRKIMHKIGFLGHPMGSSGAIYALYLKFLTQIRNLVAGFHRENVSFTRKQRISVSEPPFFAGWGLRGNVCDSSLARWKADSRLSIGYN